MDAVPSEVRREPWEVEGRLAELNLDRRTLLRVAAMAHGERGNATPFHAANAAGTFAYQQGTFALRNEHVGTAGWQIDRTNGVEAIYHPAIRVRVVFGNVDVACSDLQEPKPRSEKGSGAERSCQGNLFGHLPRYAPKQTGPDITFYLMVDDEGRTELSRPIVRGGKFTAFPERIYLFRDGDGGDGAMLPLDDSDTIIDFDPHVARKN